MIILTKRWNFDTLRRCQCHNHYISRPAVALNYDLSPPKSNQVISRCNLLFSVSFTDTAQVLHEIRCSQDLNSMAYCDLDTWSLTSTF